MTTPVPQPSDPDLTILSLEAALPLPAAEPLPIVSATDPLPPTKAELIAEGIGAILAGRPYPEHLRPAEQQLSRPATVQDGIARIIDPPAR